MDESITIQDVRDLIYREAEYLDAQEYQKWLDLYAEDARYWIPSRDSKDLDFEAASEFANAHHREKEELADFVSERAMTERSWALEGLQADRLYTNVRMTGPASGRGKWLLRMLEINQEAEMTYTGTSWYEFSRNGGDLKIRFKKAVVNNFTVHRGHLPLI